MLTWLNLDQQGLRERKNKRRRKSERLHSHLATLGSAILGTMDEATPLDYTPSESQAGYGDATNLYNVIDRDKSVL
jgi:hypothetical protein